MKSMREYWWDLIGAACIINPFGKKCEEQIMMIGHKLGGGK